ncbi:unnamed protein product, partial [Aureobasidium pullulans]
MAAGFNVIAAIREKAFGHVVENETKAAFSVSAVSHKSLLLLGKERKTKQAKGFKHHETWGSRTFVDDKHLCRTRCLHGASLHGPLTPIERHDGCEFTSIVQEEQVIGLLPLVVAFFAKYSVHSDDQLDRHLRS